MRKFTNYSYFSVSIILIFAFLFTKEWISINQEFLIILGFLVTFFLLKNLLEIPIIESLENYRTDIRKKFTDLLNLTSEKTKISTDFRQREGNGFKNYLAYKEFLLGLVSVKDFYEILTTRKAFLETTKAYLFDLHQKIYENRKHYLNANFRNCAKKAKKLRKQKKIKKAAHTIAEQISWDAVIKNLKDKN